MAIHPNRLATHAQIRYNESPGSKSEKASRQTAANNAALRQVHYFAKRFTKTQKILKTVKCFGVLRVYTV